MSKTKEPSPLLAVRSNAGLGDALRWIRRTLNIGEFVWEYGIFKAGQPARRHRKKGNVQFILWKAGQHGHAEDFWYDADRSWWPSFEAPNCIVAQENCPYCNSDNKAVRETYFDQCCRGCVARMASPNV